MQNPTARINTARIEFKPTISHHVPIRLWLEFNLAIPMLNFELEMRAFTSLYVLVFTQHTSVHRFVLLSPTKQLVFTWSLIWGGGRINVCFQMCARESAYRYVKWSRTCAKIARTKTSERWSHDDMGQRPICKASKIENNLYWTKYCIIESLENHSWIFFQCNTSTFHFEYFFSCFCVETNYLKWS